jgi:plasmid stabilization system protein ParE
MAYLVELAARAARDLEDLYVAKKASQSQAAASWYNGLEDAVLTLAARPNRCPVVPEAKKMKRELWHLLYGKKPNVYRVIYEVDEQRKTVWVLHIRYGARRKIKVADIE